MRVTDDVKREDGNIRKKDHSPDRPSADTGKKVYVKPQLVEYGTLDGLLKVGKQELAELFSDPGKQISS
jgi:hypothetical protein